MNSPKSNALTRKRLFTTVGIACVVIAALVVAFILLEPVSGAKPQAGEINAPASAAPTQSGPTGPAAPTGPTGPHGPAVPISKKTADTALRSFLASVAAIPASTSSTKVPAQLAGVASGAIVSAIENQQQELTANGWTRHGTPLIASVTVISKNLTASTPTATVSACIDSSSVTTLDSSGKSIRAADDKSSQRAINIYTLNQRGNTWVVTAQTFPDDTKC
jgi:hypothetical protein